MKTVAAKDAKERFGELMDRAQVEPVQVSKHGRPYIVMLSKEMYERLQMLEDLAWARAAEEAEKGGYLSHEESMAALQRFIDAAAADD